MSWAEKRIGLFFHIPFGELVGKQLFEQYHAGLFGFNKDEIETLKEWLIDMEIIEDAMCY